MKKVILVIGAAVACFGLASRDSVLFAQASRDAASRSGTILGPDDSITIVALDCEEISKLWRISTTGDVNFPMIGRVHLAGMSVEQAEQSIMAKLQRYLKNPQLTVYPTEVRSRPVTVAGAVERPGKYQIATNTTLFDAIILAGGPKNAGSIITVKRIISQGKIAGPDVRMDRDGSSTMVEFNLKDVADGPDGPGPKADFGLLPFDVITVVPAAAPRYVHIVGEVNRPGSVELVTQDSVSLMKVMAVAGGLTRVAAPGSTMILHINPEGVQTSNAIVDVKKIMDGKSKDLDLIGGDIILVPSSKAKLISQMFASSALTSGVSSVMYTLARF